MDLFTNADTLAGPAYSPIVFYVVATIGIGLILFRPYAGFLFGVFCLSAKNFHVAISTRPTQLGAFLNLSDLLLWIIVFAWLIDTFTKRRTIWLPGVVLLILTVVLTGFVQSVYHQGFSYLVLRKTWAAVILPLALLVGANMVVTSERARGFFITLFWGCVFASLLHIHDAIGLGQRTALSARYHEVRTIAYIFSGGSYLLVGLVFARHSGRVKGGARILYYGAIALILLSILLSFTRSVWLQMIAGIMVMGLLFPRRFRLNRVIISFGGLLFLLVIFACCFPRYFDLGQMMAERISESREEQGFRTAYRTRLEGQTAELNLWWRGNLLLGYGSTIPVEYYSVGTHVTGAALGHVGYAIYLTHYGLVGLLVYLIVLPLNTLLRGKCYCQRSAEHYGKMVVMVGIACAMMNLVGCLTSIHYLVPNTHIPGLLLGAVQGLWKSEA